MYVRCAQCGYDNSPEYRFCGMCGGPLARPAMETKPPVRDVAPPPTVIPIPASTPIQDPPPFRAESAPPGANRGDIIRGPSFLGLSEESRSDYLDEEEPKRSRTGMIVILLLLVVAGGYVGWQWRHHGFPFDQLTSNRPAEPATTPATPETGQSQEGQAPAPAETGQTPTTDAQPATAAPDNPTTPAAGGTEQASPPEAAPAAAPAEKVEFAPPGRPRKTHPKLAPAHATIAASVDKPAAASAADADLEASGERYLYGNGVTQNCARAESSLRTAATKGNSKAETVLGTMYATGHCVGKDLPAAYRWFARALHEDPQNSRISADLQVLWRQMTPEEKQQATAKQ